MILLLDAGNSRFKWAEPCLNPRGKHEKADDRRSRLSDIHIGSYDHRDRAEAVSEALRHLSNPRRILVSSVLDEQFRNAFTEWAQAHFRIKAEFIVSAKNAYGVQVAYAQPERLGTDRFAALVAAHRHYPGSCVVIDCGTAVTLDAMTPEGEHRGGLILPGLGLMRASLRDNAAGLKAEITLQDNAPLLARDTGAAIYSGTLRALAGAIDRIATDMADQLPAPVTLLLSGGDAEVLAPLLHIDTVLAPSLVLQGLAVMAEG